jgi:DNA-binding HxlR family transcriptional regulator
VADAARSRSRAVARDTETRDIAGRDAAGRETRALDPLVHDRVRLGLLSALAAGDALTFVELKRLLRVTDGNLSVHARRLEDAGFVQCTKSFTGRVPRTEYRITPAGRRGLESYLKHMEALIHATRR